MTYQDINDLIDRVEDGDPDAIAEARALSAKLSKRANVRLSALEEKDIQAVRRIRQRNIF